jgi:hypothetical protein
LIMNAVDVIMAALIAGAGAGVQDVASAAVRDTCTRLHDALSRRLAGWDQAQQVLDTLEPEAEVWPAELTTAVEESGAAHDPEILAAAQRLLALTDPAGTATGKYVVDLSGVNDVQMGDGTVRVDTVYGAAGNFHAPVSFTGPLVPPGKPGT